MHTSPTTLAEHARDVPLQPKVEPLTAENVLWSNTVLAAGFAIGFVIYTGSETRAVMNTSHPETKVGLLDLEINRLSKVPAFLCFLYLFKFAFSDFMCCNIRTVNPPRCIERVSRDLVYICFSLFNPFLLHYPYQVRDYWIYDTC